MSSSGWVLLTDKNSARLVNGIQGLLIRKHHPGLVNGQVPRWKHFYEVQDAHDEVLALKIKREFWVSL
jgi:hypothetical protein